MCGLGRLVREDGERSGNVVRRTREAFAKRSFWVVSLLAQRVGLRPLSLTTSGRAGATIPMDMSDRLALSVADAAQAKWPSRSFSRGYEAGCVFAPCKRSSWRPDRLQEDFETSLRPFGT